jgi:anti-sigma28 factor (negative regulator of flagellin synthesis)
MKINPAFQSDIVSRYMSNATSVPQKTEKTSAQSYVGGNDSVELSSGAQKYAELLRNANKAMDDSDETEDARAQEIMAQIASGSYQVSDDDVVNSLVGRGGIPEYC